MCHTTGTGDSASLLSSYLVAGLEQPNASLKEDGPSKFAKMTEFG